MSSHTELVTLKQENRAQLYKVDDTVWSGNTNHSSRNPEASASCSLNAGDHGKIIMNKESVMIIVVTSLTGNK